MKVIAWTLGNRRSYDVAVTLPGNEKAPGGYAFRTKREAESYIKSHRDLRGYGAYAMVLDRPYAEAVTRDYFAAAVGRHTWHRATALPAGTPYMSACGICNPRPVDNLDCDLLLVPAPFVNPEGKL